MLTTEDLTTLKRPFARADHEFIRGFVYITEEAITNRLEEVDPAWMFIVLDVTTSGDNAVVRARLGVKDVYRDGVGMQKVNEKAGEAEKGAATDALKRCARLFGVGRYLLGAPAEGPLFDDWLKEQRRTADKSIDVDAAKQRLGNGGDRRIPAASPVWTKEEVTEWENKWVYGTHSLTRTDLLRALGVQRYGEWTRGAAAADKAVADWLEAELKDAPTNLAEVQF